MFCNCWNQKHQLFYFYFQNIFALQNCIHKSLKNQSPVTVPQSRVRRPTASLTCVCQVVSFCPTPHLLTLLLIYFFFQNFMCVPSRFFLSNSSYAFSTTASVQGVGGYIIVSCPDMMSKEQRNIALRYARYIIFCFLLLTTTRNIFQNTFFMYLFKSH